MNQEINVSLMKFEKRAERIERDQLVETFVQVGPLFTLLSTTNNQILYGRRGTGKTHALMYLAEIRGRKKDIAVYIDLRNIGSTGGIYADQSVPLIDRATKLLQDVLTEIGNGIKQYFIDYKDSILEKYSYTQDQALKEILRIMSGYEEAIREVRITGTANLEATTIKTNQNSKSSSFGAKMGSTSNDISIEAKASANTSSKEEIKLSQSGPINTNIRFGSISNHLKALCSFLSKTKIWLLLDEWSTLPLELQPYLADLIKRTIFPISTIVTKIAAIERRSNFIIHAQGDYIGLELGADISADANLDEFMVFENNTEYAINFFKSFIFNHYKEIVESESDTLHAHDADDLIRKVFTQRNVFDEFVRASEGVPRDAMYIIGIAAQIAFNRPITMADLRKAALRFYRQDKENSIDSNPKAQGLLYWIIEEVIKQRKARAFLLKNNSKDELIDFLFDSRVIHILKKNIATHDQPGIRYDVFKLDYGCYVDLINTARFPDKLLSVVDEADLEAELDIEVPIDDYRSIRRAILEISKFHNDDNYGN